MQPMDGVSGDTLPPGTPLLQGQFLVEGFLNAGGFGITYLARDSLERRVVLKECYPSTLCCRSLEFVRARSRSQQAEFDAIVRLFGQEARRLAKLSHPNIVGVRDVFEENGTAYMALDFVDGRDLADVIEHEPDRLGPTELRAITLQLLEAVDHVHEQGMLHRDISPDNILLRADNTPVLIDFGAARDTARRKSRVLSSLHVVKDGYSPQEFYLENGEQSPASDLYALAASLYHVLSGQSPLYSHVRLAAIAEKRADPYVPLSGNVEGYEPAFLAAIDRTLAVFARDRLQRAREWIDLIEGRAIRTDGLTDAQILERIRELVESTNAEVRLAQEKRAREEREKAQREAEECAAREAARERRRAAARQEAEELERELREREAERARQKAEAEAKAAEEARIAALAEATADGEGAGDTGSGDVANAAAGSGQSGESGAGAQSAEADAQDSAEPGGARPRRTLIGAVIGACRRRPSSTQAQTSEGYGT